MNPIPDDELISAYLDGELSEADRARAEAILAEQPEARQLLEDLRALRGGFEGLPSHRVEHTFLDRVMRSAEREMLAGEPPNVKFEHVEGEPTEMRLASVERSHHRRESGHSSAPGEGWQRWRRPLAWAGLALAAGVLIMVVERAPQAPGPRGQIAEAPAPKNAEFRAPETGIPQAGEKAAETQTARDAHENLSSEFRDREESATSSKPGNMPLPAGGPAARSSESSPKSAAASLPAPVASGSGGAAAGMRASGKGGAEKEANAKSAQPPGGFGLRFGVARPQDAANMAYEVERLEDGELVSEPLDEKTLIVWCDVDKDVADRPEFRRLLVSNGIAWQPENAGAGQTAALERKLRLAEAGKAGAAKKPQEANQAQSGLEKAEAPAEQKASSLGALGDRFVRQQPATRENLQRAQIVSEALNQADSDYVFLEAPAEQLKGVLAEIDRHPELFLSVNVEPAPEAPEQRAYAAYNRGRALKEETKANLATERESKRESESYFKQAQQADKPKTAKQQASQTMLGRAQRVMVLPQSGEMLEEQLGDAKQKASGGGVAGQPAAAESRAMSRSERSKEASKKDAANETAPAEPADKRANLAKSLADLPADAIDVERSADYQQALFIFRRVQTPPAAAVPAPAKAGK